MCLGARYGKKQMAIKGEALGNKIIENSKQEFINKICGSFLLHKQKSKVRILHAMENLKGDSPGDLLGLHSQSCFGLCALWKILGICTSWK